MKEGGAGGSGFSSPMDLFDMFFGGGFGRRRGRERKGKDVIHQLSVTLEELYRGAVRKLALQKNVICEKCEGRGGKKVSYVLRIIKLKKKYIAEKYFFSKSFM